jgi:hypothetical protein
MSGKRNKKIRKAVYREMSIRQPRKYAGAEGRQGFLCFRNVGLRAEYQQAKKAFNKSKKIATKLLRHKEDKIIKKPHAPGPDLASKV